MIIRFYTLSDPRTPDEIRYVGKTKTALNRRLSGHISGTKRAFQGKATRNHNTNWIKSLLDLGLKPIIKEIESFEIEEDSKEWIILEKYWISQFKSWGFNLTNLTDGGEGNQNQYFSAESIKKRADSIRGIPRPKEVREQISKSNKGKPKSEEHIKNTREGIIKKQGRPVIQYSLKGEFIKEWRCMSEAADHYNVDRSSLMRCCQGKYKKSAGFKWKYKDEDIV